MHTVVIFDLDGTLLDTSPGIFGTANHTMKALGFEPLPDSQLRKFVGPPLAACFRIACGLEEELIDQACSIYREEYRKGKMYLASPYEGIEELLEELRSRDVTILVATLKHEEMAKAILKKKGLFSYFTSVHGSDEKGQLTKRDIILNSLDAIGRNASREILMVGDTPHDKDGASQAGVDFVAVDWGFGFHKGEKVAPGENTLGMIDTPRQLLEYL